MLLKRPQAASGAIKAPNPEELKIKGRPTSDRICLEDYQKENAMLLKRPDAPSGAILLKRTQAASAAPNHSLKAFGSPSPTKGNTSVDENAEVINLQEHSITPEPEDYEDIPEVPEEYEDIPTFSEMQESVQEGNLKSPHALPDCLILLAELAASGAIKSPNSDDSLKAFGFPSPPSKGSPGVDENFDINREKPLEKATAAPQAEEVYFPIKKETNQHRAAGMQRSTPPIHGRGKAPVDAAHESKSQLESDTSPECMASSIGVKALREKLNSQVSAKCDLTPSKDNRTPSTTREIRSLIQPVPDMISGQSLSTKEESNAIQMISEKRLQPPLTREHGEDLENEKDVHVSENVSIADIGGLQMSNDNSVEFGQQEDEEEIINEKHSMQIVGCLQLSDSPEPAEFNEKPNEKEGEDAYIPFQPDPVDDAPSKKISSTVIVLSESDHDSKALRTNDHARAILGAMREKCTARLPAPQTKILADNYEQETLQYSNEEVEAIADVLLNPKKDATAVPDTPRSKALPKINDHMREALRDIHYSPSPRASSMLMKLRKKEVGCKKVPVPKVPKGSFLGVEPGRSLMPVEGVQNANVAALITVSQTMSPHKNNNVQHSRRSKMPSKGQGAADRAALAEVKLCKTRKIALFAQMEALPLLTPRGPPQQQKNLSEYTSKTRDDNNEVYEAMPEPKSEEMRIDLSDGIAYPLESFLEVYGVQDGLNRWANAAVALDMHDESCYGPAIDGLQDIDGLQASFTSESSIEIEGEMGTESYAPLARELQDDSHDSEIFPEEATIIAVDHRVHEKVEKMQKTQGEVDEIGRKVMVLAQRVKQLRCEDEEGMQSSQKQLMGDASITLDPDDLDGLEKVQKILDLFDVISQTVCDSEENRSGKTGSNILMTEIVTLRAAQLALIQADHDHAITCVEEIKKSFSDIGYRRCHGLLDQVAKLVLADKVAHALRKERHDLAAQIYGPQEIKKHHGKRGDRILQSAHAALANGRFDHALAFIVKAKKVFHESDRLGIFDELEDLNRTIVMEATRMASDSLIVEAAHTPSRNKKESVESKADEQAAVDALFVPSDATQNLLERIDMGGRVALSQEHCELEDEIKQLRAGLEASKPDMAPRQRISCRTASVTGSPHARLAHQSNVDDSPNKPSKGAGLSLSFESLSSSDYAPVDKELCPVPARKESRHALSSMLSPSIFSPLKDVGSPMSGGYFRLWLPALHLLNGKHNGQKLIAKQSTVP